MACAANHPPTEPRSHVSRVGAWTLRFTCAFTALLWSTVAAQERHWSLRPVADPPTPQVADASWPRTDLDHFVLARLESAGLAPAAEADRRTLIRRAAFVLTGLPPTAEQVDAFVADDAPEAWHTVVERLLASDAYGERWGRHWLDLARYSDTKGYVYGGEERRFVHSHVYRDWVIRAFRDDVPYDRFLKLQLAADQMVDAPDAPDLAAMGFLTLGPRFLGVVHDIIDDRIDTTFRTMQGLTVACARCHDHKYDPVPTTDYYALYSVFASSRERTRTLAEPARAPDRRPSEQVAAYEQEHAKRRDALAAKLTTSRTALEARLRAKAREYLVAVLDVESLPTEDFVMLLGDDDINPVFVRQWRDCIDARSAEDDPIFGPWHAYRELPEAGFADRARDLATHWRTAPANVNPHVGALFDDTVPTSMREVAERYGELFATVDRTWRGLLEDAASSSAPAPAAFEDPDREALRQMLYGQDAPTRVAEGPVVELEWYFPAAERAALRKLQGALDTLAFEHPGAPPQAVLLEDRPEPHDGRVFERGNPAHPGARVARRFPAALSPTDRGDFQHGSGRLEMARAIASPDNPLTARVMVNRIWQQHFGAGLVRTPSDFGTRGTPPTHPELLDFLASRFVEDGWSIKALHRRILRSATWRQSSSVSVEAIARDPENRLLGRARRRRLEFEALRDSLLAVSGELDRTAGGPGFELTARPTVPRRTVYARIDRGFVPSVLRTFDFANPKHHAAERFETSIPQQALYLLNADFVADRARALVAGLDAAAGSEPTARIAHLYRRLYQRPPTARELEAGHRFVTEAIVEPAEPPTPGAADWSYGYGRFDPATSRTVDFAALPHFTGSAWQGGPSLPDRTLGWVRLTADGGHTGNDLAHAAIRRFQAPRAGKLSIEGVLRHELAEGEGIRGRIVSSRSGLLATWELHDQQATTAIDPVHVEAGETLDFVVDFRTTLGWDTFHWAPVLRAIDGGDEVWDAHRDFAGPAAEPLGAWEQYVQVLLVANEFAFVD